VRSTVAVVACLWLVTAVAGSVVWAKPRGGAAKTEEETPWSRGVSRADQKRALELFREGNSYFEQAKYTEAVAIYERALAVWDHPNIRFNMAFCLINMRQPLAAWSHLQQALRFGEAPLGERLHGEAMRAVAILEASLGQLTVKSSQPGIRVMVDGRRVLSGPGEHTMKLLAGKHQLVATRRGYVTDSRALDLPAGRPLTEAVSLEREKVRVLRENYERRWSWWVPWSVAGSSVVLGLAGGGLYVSARSDIKDYDRALAEMCPAGCTDEQIPQSLEHKASGARQRSGVAIGLWGAAGALLVTGGVMAILNRPHRQQEVRMVMPSVTVSRDYVGVGVSLGLE
jgi:tetratricopeptide (TPR) repeat protein